MKRKLVLIGASDSIGVPYTRDNYDHEGFYEMIEDYLAKDYDVISFNCFHMSTYNDNEYINYLLNNNVSLFDIKNSQNQMLKKCKYSGFYPFLELPKSFLNYYKINNKDKKMVVKDYIKNNETIFIYSAFVNDILKEKKLSLFKLLRPGRIRKELKNINIYNILIELEDNIGRLIDLNPNIKIFIVGLFVPTNIHYIRENLCEFILNVNKSLYDITKKYPNVIFVNNDNLTLKDFNNIDFHPNKSGHEKIYQNFMSVFDMKK